MFDAVNNLRACLDQMTYAIAWKHRDGGGFAPFPFCADTNHWPNKIKGLKNRLPPEILALFETFKPYKGGNDALWAVNELANVKKHAIMDSINPRPSYIFGAHSEKNEFEIFRSIEPPERHPNIEISYRIVIDHPEEVFQAQDPITLLDAMRSEVERVLNVTESECRTIGLFDG